MARHEITHANERLLSTEEFKNFLRGVQARFPDLDRHELEALSARLLSEVGKHLEKGEDIAFVRRKSDGSAELTILGLKPVRRHLNE